MTDETGPRSTDWLILLGWQDALKEETHEAAENSPGNSGPGDDPAV